uniref:Uncharacterized protein n=1 Tax=Lepeophtheirus salmonis TaxID=72036 RepID=A0A0K2VB34_LEPSM
MRKNLKNVICPRLFPYFTKYIFTQTWKPQISTSKATTAARRSSENDPIILA